jgi:hypothetical protein
MRPRSSGTKALFSSLDISAALQHFDDGGVGGGAANAQLFELLDQTGFGVARRRLGEMLGGMTTPFSRAILSPSVTGGRRTSSFIGGQIVGILEIDFQEAVKQQDGTGGAQGGLAAFVGRHQCWLGRTRPIPSGWRGCASRSSHTGEARRGRGTGRRPPACGAVGGADGLVRFLRVLGFGLILARGIGQVFSAPCVADQPRACSIASATASHAVGTHIGNQTDSFATKADTFIELLRADAWCGLRQCPACGGLLLQGGGGERGCGIALDGFVLNAAAKELPGLMARTASLAAASLPRLKLVELLAVEVGEAG